MADSEKKPPGSFKPPPFPPRKIWVAARFDSESHARSRLRFFDMSGMAEVRYLPDDQSPDFPWAIVIP